MITRVQTHNSEWRLTSTWKSIREKTSAALIIASRDLLGSKDHPLELAVRISASAAIVIMDYIANSRRKLYHWIHRLVCSSVNRSGKWCRSIWIPLSCRMLSLKLRTLSTTYYFPLDLMELLDKMFLRSSPTNMDYLKPQPKVCTLSNHTSRNTRSNLKDYKKL